MIYFYELARLMGPEQPFYGLQAVGLDGESAPHTTVEEMAAHYIAAIQTVQPEGPYLLGGHSFGGRVVFEMAQQLLKAGHEVARVVILDTKAPTKRTKSKRAAWDDARWLAFMAEVVGQQVGQQSSLSEQALQPLDSEEQLIRFKEELERMNFLPAGSDIKHCRGWAQVFKTNHLTNYLPREVIPTRITLFRAQEGEQRSRFLGATVEDERQQEPTWGWSELAEGAVDVVYVPGDHLTMMAPPHIQVLAKRLAACLGYQIISDSRQSSVAGRHFPITWANPADAELRWVYDTHRGYDPLTPLDFDLRIQSMTNANNTIGLLRGMPFVNRVQLFNGYTYDSITFLDDDLTVRRHQMQQVEEQIREAMLNLEALWEERYLPEIKEHLAYWQTYDLSRATLPALLEHLTETQRRVERLWEIHALVFRPAMYAMSEFEETYKALFQSKDSENDEEQAFAAYNLLSGLENKSLVAGRRLWQLSRQAKASPVVKEILQETEAGQVKEKLQLHREGRAFWADVEAYLSEYGHGNESLYLNQPSLLEEPTPLFSHLQNYLSQPDREAPNESAHQKATELRQEALAAVRKRLEGYPTMIVTQFEQLLKAAQVGTVLSEDHNYWIDTQVYYYARQVCLAVGRALVAKGMIEQAEDVFFLALTELQALKENWPTQGLQTVITERQNDLARFTTYSIGSIQTMPLSEDDPLAENSLWQAIRKFHDFIPQVLDAPDQLKGYAGSSGKARGPAKVVQTLAKLDKIQAGDILVAPFTLPSWTPIFATVSAIVTDIGGILSHTAVVAREYGIPAVVGTRTGTTTITDGQIIAVDGDKGIVQLILSS